MKTNLNVLRTSPQIAPDREREAKIAESRMIARILEAFLVTSCLLSERLPVCRLQGTATVHKALHKMWPIIRKVLYINAGLDGKRDLALCRMISMSPDAQLPDHRP